MGKYLRSLTDGSLRCRYCGDSKCNCMEDGITTILFRSIWKYNDKATAMLVQLKRQMLPNGKKIPSGVKLWIPSNVLTGIDDNLKKMGVSNDYLNKLRFD